MSVEFAGKCFVGGGVGQRGQDCPVATRVAETLNAKP